jgi:hypothetical protein
MASPFTLGRLSSKGQSSCRLTPPGAALDPNPLTFTVRRPIPVATTKGYLDRGIAAGTRSTDGSVNDARRRRLPGASFSHDPGRFCLCSCLHWSSRRRFGNQDLTESRPAHPHLGGVIDLDRRLEAGQRWIGVRRLSQPASGPDDDLDEPLVQRTELRQELQARR